MRTDGYDEANIDFSKYCESALKAHGLTFCLYTASIVPGIYKSLKMQQINNIVSYQ
jgi:hypothetical protein